MLLSFKVGRQFRHHFAADLPSKTESLTPAQSKSNKGEALLMDGFFSEDSTSGIEIKLLHFVFFLLM